MNTFVRQKGSRSLNTECPIHILGTSNYYVITFRDIFNPHPPFPTASSFGTLVGGAYLMTSYLDKHFESVHILCAADFCLQSRPVNPVVYLVQKNVRVKYNNIYYLCYIYSVCDSQDTSLWMIWEFYDVSVKHCHKIPSSCHILLDHPPLSQHWHHHTIIFPQNSGWHPLMT